MSGRTSETAERSPSHRSRLLFVIDDDAHVRQVLAEVLRHNGYQIETAATVEEAETIKRQLGAAAIGVVIIDIHLTANPRFQEGYALYEAWKALHPELPFILISGISSGQDLPAVRDGAALFLSKPFTMESLLELIRYLRASPNAPPHVTDC